MGLLDIPRGLISRLPLVGGANDSKDDSEEEPAEPNKPDEPTAEAPEKDAPDQPDEADKPDESAEADKPDEPDKSEPSDEADDKPEDAKPTDGDKPEDGDSDSEDISGTTAPSIGPNTVIHKDSPEERLARHDQSDQDAMGLDKRREVIGGNYSASFGKQLIRWTAVVLIAVAAAFGLKLLVGDLDKAPAHAADKAPWSGTNKAPPPLE